MPVITSPERIRAQLQFAFDTIEGNPLILHSDLVRVGFVPRGRTIDQQLADWYGMILDAAGKRTILFPTFNYEFARNGRYRPDSDPCQVGALNEYARKERGNRRTLTPIFNFAVVNGPAFPIEPAGNPFDNDSTFGLVRRAGGSVVFLGAGPEANTFVHHVEEAAHIPYRYLKVFPGAIETGGSSRQVSLHYRVRPPEGGAVEYDWRRLAEDMRSRRILRSFPLGNGMLEVYESQVLYDYWSDCLQQDEHFLLTKDSHSRVQRLYELHGKPLRCEAVEGGGHKG
jgi:aminoglycoside N3'-acetyltransferase